MRHFFLLLVLANLGVLAWFSWIAPAPEPHVREELPGMTLLRELDPDVVEALTRIEPVAPVVRCIAIGPFIEPDTVDTALAALTAAEFDPRLSITEEEVRDGYWVYVGRIESRASAQEMLGALRELGMDDAYVIPDSDSGILISLGVFQDIRRAGSRGEQAGRLGFDVVIEERMRMAGTQWIELTLTEDQSIDLELLPAPAGDGRLEQRECTTADA